MIKDRQHEDRNHKGFPAQTTEQIIESMRADDDRDRIFQTTDPACRPKREYVEDRRRARRAATARPRAQDSFSQKQSSVHDAEEGTHGRQSQQAV
jgi:hypothetical protein